MLGPFRAVGGELGAPGVASRYAHTRAGGSETLLHNNVRRIPLTSVENVERCCGQASYSAAEPARHPLAQAVEQHGPAVAHPQVPGDMTRTGGAAAWAYKQHEGEHFARLEVETGRGLGVHVGEAVFADHPGPHDPAFGQCRNALLARILYEENPPRLLVLAGTGFTRGE